MTPPEKLVAWLSGEIKRRRSVPTHASKPRFLLRRLQGGEPPGPAAFASDVTDWARLPRAAHRGRKGELAHHVSHRRRYHRRSRSSEGTPKRRISRSSPPASGGRHSFSVWPEPQRWRAVRN